MKTALIIAAVGIALGCVGAVTLLDPKQEATKAAQLAPGWQPAAETGRVAQAGPAAPAATGPAQAAPAQPSLTAKVKALAESKSPADSFKAAKLLLNCRDTAVYARRVQMTREAERGPRESADLKSGAIDAMGERNCGDLTPQFVQAQIVPLLERAAEAGVLNATSTLTFEGPFGNGWVDVEMRPSDPLVVAWKRRMGEVLANAAAKGDYIASMQLAENYASGAALLDEHNPYAELKYTAAAVAAHNRAEPDRPIDRSGVMVKRLAARLPAAQAQAAIAEGLQIAAAGVQK